MYICGHKLDIYICALFLFVYYQIYFADNAIEFGNARRIAL